MNIVKISNYLKNPLRDNKISANSWIITMRIGDYLGMINLKKNPYQRSLQQLSFYKKLINDLLNDGVMPPVSVVYDYKIDPSNFELNKESNFKIIDGLQRTNCLIACTEKLNKLIINEEFNIKTLEEFYNKEIYVEIWEKIDLKSILYKMVVLNTGQRKMDYSHQLDILSESVEIELKESGIEYISILEKQETKEKQYKFLLSDITTGLVSYINRSPISGKKNAAEFLFNKLDVGNDSEKEILLIDDNETYKMMKWILKDFSQILDNFYGKEKNPLIIYDVFLTSFFAAMGLAKEKASKNPLVKETLEEKIKYFETIGDGNDILDLEEYINYTKLFKSGIGDKRRKFIFEAIYDFLISSKDRSDKLEWSNTYERFFSN